MAMFGFTAPPPLDALGCLCCPPDARVRVARQCTCTGSALCPPLLTQFSLSLSLSRTAITNNNNNNNWPRLFSYFLFYSSVAGYGHFIF